jgi:hypothetical protein
MAGPQRKAPADIYTAILAIALVAILLSIVFMYLEAADYGADKYKGAPPVSRLESPTAPAEYALAQQELRGAASTAARLAAIT